MARNYGNVKPWVKAAGEEIADKFGVEDLGGYYFSTWGEHPLGRAIDFMCTKSQGDAIAAYAQANYQRLSVMYIIWYRRIWSVARINEGWRSYGLSNPHTDHVHISFNDQPGAGGPVQDVGLFGSGDMTNVIKAAEWISNPENWKRIALFVSGAALIILGIVRMMASGILKR